MGGVGSHGSDTAVEAAGRRRGLAPIWRHGASRASMGGWASGIAVTNQFVATAVAEKISALRTAAFFSDRAARADVDAARRLLRRQGGQPPEPEDQLDENGESTGP